MKSPEERPELKFALLGRPLGKSLSKKIFFVFSKILGLNISYKVIETADLKASFERLMNEGYDGFNVTAPYKAEILRYVPPSGGIPAATFSANAVKLSGGGATAANTDAEALFFASSGISFSDKKALVLGAGGAARTAVYCLAVKGAAEITVASRVQEKAESVCAHFAAHFPGSRFYHSAFRGFDRDFEIIVNATPLGMYEDWKYIPKAGKAVFLVDFAYDGLNRTRFLSISEKAEKIAGIDLLILQAVFSLRFWTGIDIDAEDLKKKTIKKLESMLC